MKILFILFFPLIVNGQNIFAKFMIHPSKKLSENVDSLITALAPMRPDSAIVPKGTKFYDILVTNKAGFVMAYKIHNKPWTNKNTQGVLNAFTLSILYYMKQGSLYYDPTELLEIRDNSGLKVYLKLDKSLLASFTYSPINYLIPRK